MTGEFSAQRASNAEMLPFDDVILQCLKMTTVHSKANAKMNTYINTFRVILCEHLLSLLTYPGLVKDCNVKLLLKGIDQGTDWSIALKKIYFTEFLQLTELLFWRYYSHGLSFFVLQQIIARYCIISTQSLQYIWLLVFLGHPVMWFTWALMLHPKISQKNSCFDMICC